MAAATDEAASSATSTSTSTSTAEEPSASAALARTSSNEDDDNVRLSDLPNQLASKAEEEEEEEESSKVRTLAEIGTRIPIPGDGNCGFAACRRGLGESMSITEFRRTLYFFAVANYLMFCGAPRYNTHTGELAWNHRDPLRVFAADDSVAQYRIDHKTNLNSNRIEMLMKEYGKPKSWFSSNRAKSRLERFKDRIKMIWKEGIDDLDFEGGCESEFYFDIHIVLCILAMKYKRTFVVYQRGEAKAMSVAQYLSKDGGKVSYYLHHGEWRSPPEGSVCIVHDGRIHYEYLQLKPSL